MSVKKTLKLLIVGCPHSGTLFTARVLQAVGIACGHEVTYSLHGYKPRGDLVAEVSWEGTLHLGTATIDPRVVLAHQTRDPLAWLNSWLREGAHQGAWQQLERAYPWLSTARQQDPTRAAMRLWVNMNQRCGQYVRRRYRVEDLRDDRGVTIINELVRAAGISLDLGRMRTVLTAANTRTNHHAGDPSHVPLTWGRLPEGDDLDKFRGLARAYGYASG